MLDKLFTSKTRVKLLDLLMFNQERDYHLREIAKIIGVSPIYTSKELANLIKLNLVNLEHKANLSLYSINKDCMFLSEMRKLFLKLKKKDKIKLEIKR